MDLLIGLLVLFLLIRFGGAIIEGLFDAVGALGKLGGIILGVIFVYLFLTGGCG
jgi:hypothetical protein